MVIIDTSLHKAKRSDELIATALNSSGGEVRRVGDILPVVELLLRATGADPEESAAAKKGLEEIAMLSEDPSVRKAAEEASARAQAAKLTNKLVYGFTVMALHDKDPMQRESAIQQLYRIAAEEHSLQATNALGLLKDEADERTGTLATEALEKLTRIPVSGPSRQAPARRRVR